MCYNSFSPVVLGQSIRTRLSSFFPHIADTLRLLGIELMITFWPFQTTPSTHWQQFNSSGYLATALDGSPLELESNYYVYDPTNPAARAATFADWYAGYGVFGVKTLWLDAAGTK